MAAVARLHQQLEAVRRRRSDMQLRWSGQVRRTLDLLDAD